MTYKDIFDQAEKDLKTANMNYIKTIKRKGVTDEEVSNLRKRIKVRQEILRVLVDHPFQEVS